LERSGAAGNSGANRKLLKPLVGAWGFEPQTPTVSISNLVGTAKQEMEYNSQPYNNFTQIHAGIVTHCYPLLFHANLVGPGHLLGHNFFRAFKERPLAPNVTVASYANET